MTERTDCIWFVYTGGQDVECDPPVSSLSLTMNCGWELIKVIYSNYGRTAPYDVVCPYPRGSSEDVARVSSIADQISCDGQRWCQVNIVPPATDPCLNTGKYAEVRFVCQGKRDNFSYPNMFAIYENEEIRCICNVFAPSSVVSWWKVQFSLKPTRYFCTTNRKKNIQLLFVVVFMNAVCLITQNDMHSSIIFFDLLTLFKISMNNIVNYFEMIN